MYRDDQEIATTDVHNFVLNHGALGDVICSLPAIVHARRTHHAAMKMKVWVPPYQVELVQHLLAPYGEIEVLDITPFPMKKIERDNLNIGSVSINQPAFNTHTRNRVHMVDFAFAYLTDSRPEDMRQRSYPNAADLGPRRFPSPGKYVVFPIGATSDNKLFKAAVMEPIIQWVDDNGYIPVLVGKKESGTRVIVEGQPETLVIRDEVDKLDPLVKLQCVDMREMTTLMELRDLLGHAEAVVGVDGGTLHLAGTTDTNIIYAMGTTLPDHRYIARGGDPNHKIRYVGPRDLACTGCQSRWTMTSLDFRFCAYGDNACMSLLHPDDFINGLRELGL